MFEQAVSLCHHAIYLSIKTQQREALREDCMKDLQSPIATAHTIFNAQAIAIGSA